MSFHNLFKNSHSIFIKCLVGSFLGTFSSYYQRKYTFNMNCGLVGILSNENNAEKSCLKSLEIMEQSDSAEIATIDINKNLVLSKCDYNDESNPNCLNELKKIVPTKHKEAKLGLLQTVWSTCGSNFYKTCSKFQTDESNRIILAHIGEINNYEEMKDELTTQYHITLQSNTNSEIIMQYVGLFMKSKSEMSLQNALNKTLQKIEGSWGVIAFDRENPNSMIVSKNQQHILVGVNPNSIYVTTEIKTLYTQCSEIYPLRNKETIELKLETMAEIKENDEFYQTSLYYRDTFIPKSPYIHIFEEEIYEQASSVYQCLGYGSRLTHSFEEDEDACKIDELKPHLKKILNIKNLLLLAKGTSYSAILYALKSFRLLETFDTVQAINMEEFELCDLPLEDAGVIIATESAETYELFKIVNNIKEKGVFVIGIANQVSNCLKACFDVLITLNCGKEESIVNSKSFICEVVMLQLINIWLSNQFFPEKKKMVRSDYKDSLRQLPLYINECLNSQKSKIKKLAETLAPETSLLIVGKGPSYAIAKEGALKFMQLAKIHTEAIYAGEMKHGPLALVNPLIFNATKSSEKIILTNKNIYFQLVIFLIFEDENTLDMELTLSEIKLRGAYTIVFTDCLEKVNTNCCDEYYEVPKLQYLTTLLAVIPFQILAYEIGLIKNINSDLLPYSFKY